MQWFELGHTYSRRFWGNFLDRGVANWVKYYNHGASKEEDIHLESSDRRFLQGGWWHPDFARECRP